MRTLIAVLALLCSGAVQARAPSYRVERCCQLCPEAADPARYDSNFLQANRVLLDGHDGWMFRSETDLTQQFGPEAEGVQELRRFGEALRRRGTELVLVYLPTRGLVHPDRLAPGNRAAFDYAAASRSYASALAALRSAGLTVPDLTPLLNEPARDDAYFFKRDHHWTPYGAQRAAALVAEAVKAMPVHAELPQKQFSTVRNGLMRKAGTLQMAAERLCGSRYSDQWVPAYGTAVETSADRAGEDLFGDAAAPQVALVGTSFSKSAVSYNFDGYLQEQLGAELVNEAAAGTGFDGAMLQYLPTESYQSAPPKLLLWEVPSYYPLNARLFYRQAVPLVNNGCAGREPLLSATKALKPGAGTELLFNGGGQVLPIKARDVVLDLQFSDPQWRQLQAQIWYMTGRKDSLKIEHGSRVEARGRFVTELRTDGNLGDLTFLSMDISLPADAPADLTVEAKLCERIGARSQARQ